MTGPWNVILFIALSGICRGQLRSDSSGLQAIIPPSLIDCYRNQSLLTRENLPPMTLNVLLAIVRKLETLPGSYLDMRMLSSQLMTSYRMDGIEKNPDVAATQYVTPYGPSGNQFYRYKILMDGLISPSGNTFPLNALKSEEKCAIHLMLSASVDRYERGDENQVCNSLTNYVRWDSRVPRDTRSYEEEVEIMEKYHRSDQVESGKWMEGGFTGLSCPLENGVVYTKYGAVKFGLVLGGIAAGLQSQSVSRRNLILVAKAKSLRGQTYNTPRLYSADSNPSISNLWAATLSGEIAEVALLQGPLSSNQMRVGLNGGWNDSVLPRYYFLKEDNKDAMSDTDIRGSIDGLILGSNAQSWSSQVGGGGGLKLSQLLDMYYSERGVLNTNTRACARLSSFNSMFTPDQIVQQSYAFSGVLELELPPAVNVADEGLQNFNTIATQKLISYVGSMAENQCSFGSTTYTNMAAGQVTNIVTPAVHLYLVIDFSFDYLDAARIASQLAEKLEVSRFTGNISIINAKDTTIVVNSTNNILDVYLNFTRNNYTKGQRGFDLPRIVRDLGSLLQRRLDEDSQYSVTGGPASVVLVVAHNSATVGDGDRNYIYNRIADIRKTVPDSKFMYLTPGAKDKFTPFAEDTAKDVFSLNLADIPTSIDAVITRFKEVPRRLLSPSCRSFTGNGVVTPNVVYRAYIEPVGGVQYYRLHPNYFYNTRGGAVRISSPGGRTLNICQSRVNVRPGNSSQSDQCRQITSDSFQTWLDSSCGDSDIVNCAPLYLSVAVVPSNSPSVSLCSDDNCRYPDNVPVDIRLEGLTCTSEAWSSILNTSNLLIFLTLVYQFISNRSQ